jgi:hypothetical protein
MKNARPKEYVIVERRPSRLPVVFVGVFCLAAGALAGDWTADRRFEERAASLVDYVSNARAEIDKVRESLKRGCYDYVDPRAGKSRYTMGEMK